MSGGRTDQSCAPKDKRFQARLRPERLPQNMDRQDRFAAGMAAVVSVGKARAGQQAVEWKDAAVGGARLLKADVHAWRSE